VFVSYGGAVTKISDQLDGIYATGPIFALQGNFTSAIADLYSVLRVYMLLLPIVDPVTGALENKLLMWDEKKWTTASQDKSLTFVTSQEINSVITAWGTDGTQIFPLFKQPNANLTKTFQTKLWSMPAYFFQKQMLRMLGIIKDFSGFGGTLSITSDSESNSSSPISVPVTGLSPSNPFGVGSRYQVFGPVPIGNQGRMLGLTVSTQAEDMCVMSITMVDQIFESNV
jgi:hypothetical protein